MTRCSGCDNPDNWDHSRACLESKAELLTEAVRVLRIIRDKGFDYWRDTDTRVAIEAVLRATGSASLGQKP